jgi:hypothetical protein
MHGSLLEVGKSTITHLDITVDGNGSWGLISLITYEITTYQVDTTSGETDQGREFLVETIWDRLQGEYTLSKDHSSAVDAEDRVHVTSNVEFLKGLYASFWPVLDVLLSFFEFFRKLDTRVSENDSLKIDQLPFFEFDIDHGAGVSNNDNFRILVSLFYSDTGLCYWLIASVDTLCQPNDTILLGEV